MGLARMNASGHVIWRLPLRTHHSVTRDEEGNFWVCAMRWVERGDERLKKFPGLQTPLGEDFAVAQIDTLYRCLDRLLVHNEEPMPRAVFLFGVGD